MTKNTKLRRIAITGQKDAFLVLIGEREVGTVSRQRPGCRWVAYRGIGQAARHAGNADSKRDAAVLAVS